MICLHEAAEDVFSSDSCNFQSCIRLYSSDTWSSKQPPRLSELKQYAKERASGGLEVVGMVVQAALNYGLVLSIWSIASCGTCIAWYHTRTRALSSSFAHQETAARVVLMCTHCLRAEVGVSRRRGVMSVGQL